MSINDSAFNTRDLQMQAKPSTQKQASAKKSHSITNENVCADERPIGYYYVSQGPNHSVPEAMAVLKFRVESRERWSGAWARLDEERRRPSAVRLTTSRAAKNSSLISPSVSIEPLAIMMRNQRERSARHLRSAPASYTTGR